MISAPSEMRCIEMPVSCITTKVIASTSGMCQRHHQPGAQAKADEADHEHDGDRLEQRPSEVADRLLDHHRLVGDEMHPDADRQLADDPVHLVVQRLAELEQVGPGLHADGQPDRRLALVAEQRLRRVGVAAGDGRDVAEAEEAVVDAQVDALQACLGAELAADAQADALRPRLHDAGRRDCVLRPERRDHVLLVDAEGRELAGGKLQEDHLVLGADQLDPAGVRHGQHLGAHCLDIVAELALGQSVGGEGVDVAEDVAKAVVEGGTDDALRELAADVVDHVAHLHPGGGHGGRRRCCSSGSRTPWSGPAWSCFSCSRGSRAPRASARSARSPG